MSRGRVEIPVELLDVLAVVAFLAGKSEEALFENRVDSVPERHTEANEPSIVAEPEKPVFAPAVRTRRRVVEG
jgi:hypothetical protein